MRRNLKKEDRAVFELVDAVERATASQPRPTRRENSRRIQDFACAIDVVVRATCVSLDPASFCAACEAVWPALDPAALVRDARRVYTTKADGIARPHSSLRGMLLELHAVCALCQRCATRLRELYYDPEYATWIDEDVTDAARSSGGRRDFRSLMALMRRYGDTASHAITTLCPIDDELLDSDELFAMAKTFVLERSLLVFLLVQSVERHRDFFFKCFDLVRSKRDGLDHAPTTRMMELLRRCEPMLTRVAASSGNWPVLSTIVESPAFGGQNVKCRRLDGRTVTKRSAMIVEAGQRTYCPLFDNNVEIAVFTLATDDVPTTELYLCAAACAKEYCWAATRILTAAMRARGGVDRVPDADRTFVRNTLYHAVIDEPAPRRADVVATATLVMDILQMLKADHTEPEDEVCKALQAFIKEDQ